MTKKKRKTNKKRRAFGKGRSLVTRGSDVARGKISEVVLDIARPWIERLGPDPPLPAVEFAYQTCSLVWNVSRMSKAEDREDEFKKVAQEVIAIAPRGTEREMMQLIQGCTDVRWCCIRMIRE